VNVAVMTLTRDRLEYTQHCFETLERNAGCQYDHYVLDQGSTDETVEWLNHVWARDGLRDYDVAGENIGCCRGWNRILDDQLNPALYDVIVCFDNDCEVLTWGTLDFVARVANLTGQIVAPHVRGLRNPPPSYQTVEFSMNGVTATIDLTEILGNVFMAIPSRLLYVDGFRWDEAYAVWAGGESITAWHRARGGWCGYVRGYDVNHYRTTDGQHVDFPWYFDRRVREGGPV
jgi:hypothetical protein